MAAPNPDPARITDAMWRLWSGVEVVIPGVRLGGIYADKVCYHNTVNANKVRWPGAYCIQHPLDLKGPQDKARAIDLTMSTAEMTRRTNLLRAAAVHPDDNRLMGVREFIGTLDGSSVYCLIRSANGVWEFDGTRDTSHLWHIHMSVFTFYCDSWPVLQGVLSVLSGETWEQWKARKGEIAMAELFTVDGGPAIMASDGGFRWGFANWDEAVAWANWWRVPTTNLRNVASKDLDRLLGPDRANYKGPKGEPGEQGPPGPATLEPHTHRAAIMVGEVIEGV